MLFSEKMYQYYLLFVKKIFHYKLCQEEKNISNTLLISGIIYFHCKELNAVLLLVELLLTHLESAYSLIWGNHQIWR